MGDWTPGKHIRVKAFIVIPNKERTYHLVSLMKPSKENPNGFVRLIGGSVEVGETHEQAIRREVDEELGAVIENLRYLDVIENIFPYNGGIGHEIIFLYVGEVSPLPEGDNLTLTEIDGTVVPLVWRPFNDADESLPLFPDQRKDLIAGCGR